MGNQKAAELWCPRLKKCRFVKSRGQWRLRVRNACNPICVTPCVKYSTPEFDNGVWVDFGDNGVNVNSPKKLAALLDALESV